MGLGEILSGRFVQRVRKGIKTKELGLRMNLNAKLGRKREERSGRG